MHTGTPQHTCICSSLCREQSLQDWMPRGLVMSPTVTLAFPCRHGWHSERPVRGRTGLAKAQADPSTPNYERWREQPEHTSYTVNKGWSTGAAVGARVMPKARRVSYIVLRIRRRQPEIELSTLMQNPYGQPNNRATGVWKPEPGCESGNVRRRRQYPLRSRPASNNSRPVRCCVPRAVSSGPACRCCRLAARH